METKEGFSESWKAGSAQTSGAFGFGGASAHNAGRTSEERRLARFTSISVSGVGELYVTPGDCRVVVEFDPHLLASVTTTVDRTGRLHVAVAGSFRSGLAPRLDICCPYLTAAELDGAPSLRVAGLSAPAFDCAVSGASRMSVAGKVTRLDVRAAGAAYVDAFELVAAEVTVGVTGAATALVNAQSLLDAAVSGAGTIEVRGQPLSRRFSEGGAGRIMWAK